MFMICFISLKGFQYHALIETKRLALGLASYALNVFGGSYVKVSEYDQEIPQSHTADQPTTPRGRVTEHL